MMDIIVSHTVPMNREKTLRHVVMVAKFLG